MTTPYIDPQTVHNPSPGNSPPAAWGDTVRDDLEFLIAPPMVKAFRSSAQSIPNNVATAVQFNSTDVWDTDAFHDTVTNNTRITIPTGFGGRYLFTAHASFFANATGNRRLAYLAVNGTTQEETVAQVQPVGGGVSSRVNVNPTILQLTPGNYVEMFVLQDSGGALNVEQCFISATWVSR